MVGNSIVAGAAVQAGVGLAVVDVDLAVAAFEAGRTGAFEFVDEVLAAGAVLTG